MVYFILASPFINSNSINDNGKESSTHTSTDKNTDNDVTTDILTVTDSLAVAVPAKKAGLYRVTRNQEGVLLIGLNNALKPNRLNASTLQILGPSRYVRPFLPSDIF